MDELESHLRDDVEQQMRLGLSEQKAFEIAVRQIGTPHALGKEFVKMSLLNSGRMAGFRLYMIGINFLCALLTGPEIVTQLLVFISLQLLYEASLWLVRYSEHNAKKRVGN